MAGTVKRRLGHTVTEDGGIVYDEHAEAYEVAEQLAGRRLDRRRSYCIIDNQVCDCGSWTRTCSGCEGGGCHECGYRGKVRESMWIPLSAQQTSE